MKIGILGGGQLGQMLADAAHPLSLETVVLEGRIVDRGALLR